MQVALNCGEEVPRHRKLSERAGVCAERDEFSDLRLLVAFVMKRRRHIGVKGCYAHVLARASRPLTGLRRHENPWGGW